MAIQYFELLRSVPGGPDPTVLLQMGRCYLDSGEQEKAEEHFLAALDADEDNIDARIELANMYEKAREDEEALIFAAEAMALRGVQDQSIDVDANLGTRTSAGHDQQASRKRSRGEAPGRTTLVGSGARRPTIPRRYRPKRLAGPDRRQQDEQARALKLSQQYAVVRDLKQRISEGHEELTPAWMASSKELIDDFRSLKRFYTWDKYLHFLGSKGSLKHPGSSQPDTELSQMYERLSRCKLPDYRQIYTNQSFPNLHGHIVC